MQAAAVAREELAHGIAGVERLEQFDLALAGFEQRGADALLFNRGARGEMQAERVAPEFQARVETRHNDADVMNLFEHRRASAAYRGISCAATRSTASSSRASPGWDVRRASAPACCMRPGYCQIGRAHV